MTIGLFAPVLAAEEGLDLIGRKNEAILSGVVWSGKGGNAFAFVHFQNFSGFAELAFFSGATPGLDLAELVQGAFELA
jgi:hypothetical protein